MSYSKIHVQCPNCKSRCEYMGFGSWFYCDTCDAGFDPFSKDKSERRPNTTQEKQP